MKYSTTKTGLFFWFLSKPKLYQELFRRGKRKLYSLSRNLEQEKARTVRWCEENGVDTQTAITQITGNHSFVPFEEKFAEQVKKSKEVLSRYPAGIGGPGNLDLIYQLAEWGQVRRVIETGVASGWSSLAFLLSITERADSLLVSTDMPYAFDDSDQYVGCVVPSELRTNWQLLPYPDGEALPQALARLPEIDMCHYDSDKSYEGRQWAYPQLWQALRPGGIFVSDDIDDNLGFHDFCQTVGQKPWIVKTPVTKGVKYVGILVKPAGNS